MAIKSDDLLTALMENDMNEQYPHKGEEWVHKDGSGLVTIDAMLKYDTFYTKCGDKWTCGTETFKKMYTEKGAWELSQNAYLMVEKQAVTEHTTKSK